MLYREGETETIMEEMSRTIAGLKNFGTPTSPRHVTIWNGLTAISIHPVIRYVFSLKSYQSLLPLR